MNGDLEEINVDDLFAAAEKHRAGEDTQRFDEPSSAQVKNHGDLFASKLPKVFPTAGESLMSPPKATWELEGSEFLTKPTFNYRLHEFWRGNNEFCWDGRFLSGLRRTSAKKTLTLAFVLLLLACYLALPLPYLFTKVSRILALMPVYMLLITVFFYVLTVT